MAIDFNGLKNELSEGRRYNVYLFEGEDAYFGARGLLLLKNTLVTEPELNFAEFDGKAETTEILNSFNMYPFMSDYRLTAVKEYYPNKESLKILIKELENPNERGILAIINQKPTADLKKLPNVCVIDCAKWTPAVISRWIRSECAKNEVAIDSVAADKISEYCLCDMFRISTETEKLCSYVGNGGTINDKVVDELVWRDNEHKIYELTDYVCRRKIDKALSTIDDMFAKGESTQRLSASLYNHFRRLLHVAISTESDSALASKFGVKEFAIKKTREQAKFFKVRMIKKAVDFLTESDFKIKRGLVGADETFWITVFKIMTEE